MGVKSGGARLCAIAGGCAVVALSGIAAAAPAAATDLSEAAQDVAAARKKLDRATAAADTADDAAARAAGDLAAARAAHSQAREDLRDAERTQTRAAATAKRATAAEGTTAQSAAAARSEMVQIVRSAYINGSGNAELAAFVDFATVGPSALSALASHNIAVERIEVSVVDRVERTGDQAEDAAASADTARGQFDAAVANQKLAAQRVVSTRDRLTDAAAAAGAAQRATRKTDKSLAGAQRGFDEARSVFRDELQRQGGSASGVARAPGVSAGNQAQLVWDILIGEGFSPESTAGILGNLQQESNIDPTTMQNGGPGMGMAQWSRGGRWDNGPNSLLAFAGARGLDPWNAVTQTRFMIYEMEAGWGGFDIDSFKRMSDVLAATVYFHDEFEGSADSAAFVRSVRGAYALHWYQTLLS